MCLVCVCVCVCVCLCVCVCVCVRCVAQELKEDNRVLQETKEVLEDQVSGWRARSDKLHQLEKHSLLLSARVHDLEQVHNPHTHTQHTRTCITQHVRTRITQPARNTCHTRNTHTHTYQTHNTYHMYHTLNTYHTRNTYYTRNTYHTHNMYHSWGACPAELDGDSLSSPEVLLRCTSGVIRVCVGDTSGVIWVCVSVCRRYLRGDPVVCVCV